MTHVVVIVADDLGYGDLGCFGNPVARTPHLDRLAAEGLAFPQHYAASPLCAPARAGLLTGRAPHRTGAVDVPSNRGLDRISLRETTLADVFRRAGHATGMVGKWHNGVHDPRYHPARRGFDETACFLNGGMDYWDWVLDVGGAEHRADGRYLTDVFTDHAVDFIDRHRAHPFCLYLAYNAPHAPFQAPEALVQPYRDRGDLTEEVCRLYAMIEAMDAGVGRLLEALDRTGAAPDTAVLFVSDNGPYLAGPCARANGPWQGAKGDVLEGGIRVPALLRWPAGLPAGRRIDDMVHSCDWLPTLASLAGVPAGAQRDGAPAGGLPLDGWDLAPRLRGGTGDLPTVRYWQRNRYAPVPRCNGAMRDGPWKLVWPMRTGADAKEPEDNVFYQRALTEPAPLMDVDATLPERSPGPPGPPRLFDVEQDPGETTDRANDEPQRLRAMVRAWDAWFERMQAEWRTAWSRNTAPAPD